MTRQKIVLKIHRILMQHKFVLGISKKIPTSLRPVGDKYYYNLPCSLSFSVFRDTFSRLLRVLPISNGSVVS